jgi:hypothetical protein
VKACAEAYPPVAAKTATTTAIPNTPPSSRIMLLTPAALPSASLATEPTTEFCAEGIAIETPTPAMMNGASMCE